MVHAGTIEWEWLAILLFGGGALAYVIDRYFPALVKRVIRHPGPGQMRRYARLGRILAVFCVLATLDLIGVAVHLPNFWQQLLGVGLLLGALFYIIYVLYQSIKQSTQKRRKDIKARRRSLKEISRDE